MTGSFAAARLATGALALGSAAGRRSRAAWSTAAAWRCCCRWRVVHASGLLLVWLLGAADAPTGALAAPRS